VDPVAGGRGSRQFAHEKPVGRVDSRPRFPLLAPVMADVVAALAGAKQLYVATRRKDGTPSRRVPVWFMWDGDAIHFTTQPGTHKAKRIERGSPLLVAVGAPDGPAFEAPAEIVRDPDVAARMAPVYNRKYWIARLGFFRPRPERVRAGKTVIVRVRPPAARPAP
jgi:PPOX class probable F420-dependent enzyme